ncbi:diiron oxygenase [Micromonospora sp. HM5-17]|jgi:hypothetical protein|uniref:diiron oxygenase n=1 Tax=Micromonospora sp. HM5-17 TaxID=2487710 RepID=UPI000F476D45|nr:diiron oxygenase [Micromonospora sp. HM5-17]ROT26084.1 AurF domain containing protein [Micromonospora sp. HM5-17]
MTKAAAGSALSTALASIDDTVARLSHLSRRSYQNPYTALSEWPETVRPDEEWFSSPEYVSLYGTRMWDELDEPARRRLAFQEAANFYSLNIHGEKSLMRGLAARLYRPDLLGVADYLHHFLDEENKHSIYFGQFCRKYARIYRSRQIAGTETRPQHVEDLLFFAKTLIFEEIVDYYNRVQARDGRLHPVARFINHNHHYEEARHLVFGRRLLAVLWEVCTAELTAEQVDDVRDYLSQFFVMTWREFYNPDVYAEVNLPEPWELAETAWTTPYQRDLRRRVSAGCVKFLISTGILSEEPHDAY